MLEGLICNCDINAKRIMNFKRELSETRKFLNLILFSTIPSHFVSIRISGSSQVFANNLFSLMELHFSYAVVGCRELEQIVCNCPNCSIFGFVTSWSITLKYPDRSKYLIFQNTSKQVINMELGIGLLP